MKLSAKLQEDNKDHRPPPLLLRAKLPISIFNLPFLSHFSTNTANLSQLSLSLSTNLSSGPSVKLSYATAAASAASVAVTLKSGTGVFGSPKYSPLIISAKLSYNPSNPNNPNPTFSLHFKPQLGSFSLRKSTYSHSKSDISSVDNSDSAIDSSSFGFVPLERPASVNDFSANKNDNDSIFKGVQLVAQTQLPVAKRVAVNFRWLVKVPEDSRVIMPVLKINKIGIQRIDHVVEADKRYEISEDNSGELEMLKSICFWMKKEMDVLSRVNREMKCELEEMKTRNSNTALNVGIGGGDSGKASGKRAFPISSGSRRSDVGEERGGRKEEKNGASLAMDMEDEFQRAIKAAAAASGAP